VFFLFLQISAKNVHTLEWFVPQPFSGYVGRCFGMVTTMPWILYERIKGPPQKNTQVDILDSVVFVT
jgi:hypothetical protein